MSRRAFSMSWFTGQLDRRDGATVPTVLESGVEAPSHESRSLLQVEHLEGNGVAHSELLPGGFGETGHEFSGIRVRSKTFEIEFVLFQRGDAAIEVVADVYRVR